jgi:hypothetical protein
MKTALLLIPETNGTVERYEYLQMCIEKVTAEGFMPFTASVYENYQCINQDEFIDKVLPLVDIVYLFVDFGIDKRMFDVIDRSVSVKMELRYRRVSFIQMKRAHKTPFQVLLEVAKKSGYTIDELQSKSRKREIVDLRFVYFRRAKESSNASLAVIGAQVGKDHASVLHGLKEAHKTKAVVDLYYHLYGQTNIKAASLESDKTNRPANSQPIERPVLPYRSMDKREQNVPARKSFMCGVPAGGYYNAFGGYRPHST